jgi:hypothetical protein
MNDVPGMYLQTTTDTMVGIETLPEALRWLGRNGVTVVGMEGFRAERGGIVPMLDYIADLSLPRDRPVLTGQEASEAAARIAAAWLDAAKADGPQFVLITAAEAEPGRSRDEDRASD